MAPRAYWKGFLRLSLLACPIQLFPATSEREKIRFHLINRKTGHRIKNCRLDAVTGKPVNDEDVVRGYEIGKGRYVEIPTRNWRPSRSEAHIRSTSTRSCRGRKSTSSIGTCPTTRPPTARSASRRSQ